MKRPLIGVNSTYYEDNHKWYKVPINYLNAIFDAGGLPVVVPCKADEKTLKTYLQSLDAMVFTGGDDYPPEWSGGKIDDKTEVMVGDRAETDRMLVKKAIEDYNMPVLGICAGHQLLALYYGEKLDLHIKDAERHGGKQDTTHSVSLTDESRLKSIFKQDTIIVNSNHHQAVHADLTSSEIKVTAWSEDGIIEAIESNTPRFVLGVQWHPERVKNKEHTQKLFNKLILEANERKLTE